MINIDIGLYELGWFLSGALFGAMIIIISKGINMEGWERKFFGLAVAIVWIYKEVILLSSSIILNIFFGLVIAHFFEWTKVQDALIGVINRLFGGKQK